MSDLGARLLDAHGARDRAALVGLYAEAADNVSNPDAAAFYLTHAYVYALELNHPSAPALRARLVASGRERE
ncbi:hypothetical protein [Sedimentitalea nanhaiensis]|uniref:Uncharacterized protein n=1 Tax=Sedimentitalea nanhaiensis TaxID=999627 RepID=A0A1I7DZU4_9RHOB|nr:hypothetical protein [Sedimentitalea nanhaiensis]SFU17176.1 hypothetical protein SAMN05216236_13910 [Sedimentitalea nanhaiensis]